MLDHRADRVAVRFGRAFMGAHRFLVQAPLASERHAGIGSGSVAGKLRDQQINQTWLHLCGLLVD